MKNIQTTQQGKAPIILIIILALIGVGVYVGVQYIPQHIEKGTVNSILDDINKTYEAKPARSASEIQNSIGKYLNLNEMNTMAENFSVIKKDGKFIVTVTYQRELNLIYEKKQMNYERSLILPVLSK
jgi:hypothetical protein